MLQERLVEYIESKGIKQVALADRCGMTAQAVSDCMNGRRRFTLDEYYRICKFLEVSMDFFGD